MASALALRAGRANFCNSLQDFGTLAGNGDLVFKVLPIQPRIRIGLLAAARIISQVTEPQPNVDETDDAFISTIRH